MTDVSEEPRARLGGRWGSLAQSPGAGSSPRKPTRTPDPAFSGDDRSRLAQAVEIHVVPRLVLAHGTTPLTGNAVAPAPCGLEEAKEFAEFVLTHDVQDACKHVEALRRAGRSLEAIYIDVVAPAGRQLHSLWRADLCDFASCALGLWRLQQLLREFSVAFQSEGHRQEHGYRALLVPKPGEKGELCYIMFGLVMVGEFYRRNGWDTWIEPDPTSTEFATLIRSQWFDVVEFLASNNKNLDALASSIRMIRRESSNKALGVMLRGKAFVQNPELVVLVGGDAAAADASIDALQAQTLVRLLADRV